MDSRTAHPTSLMFAAKSIWRHRGLIIEMSRRDVIGRYRGSMMGLAWSFLYPILMLAVYTFVFSVVFKARWGVTEGESRIDFALILFVGLIAHGLFAECAQRAPNLILSNVNYVKKVIFPLEILAVTSVCSTLFHTGVSVLVLLAAMVLTGTPMHWTSLLLPIVLAPLIIATLGLAWLLASLGVFLRDVSQTIGIVTTVLMFLSPIFYPASSLPAEFQPLFALNPLTFVIEQSRNVVVWGRLPDWYGWCIYMAFAIGFTAFGFWWFQRTRKGFADVV